MPLEDRFTLNWEFYMTSSSDATWYDVSAYDWYGMYCGYTI
jgi:hypothetical protein